METAFSERSALQYFDGKVQDSPHRAISPFIDLEDIGFQPIARRRNPPNDDFSTIIELPDRLVRVSNDMEEEIREAATATEGFAERDREEKPPQTHPSAACTEAGDIIQELKPVFMMSPLSIANYLAPDSVEFDLVVFDEASQVRPVDALGSLLRGKKAVVVGDSKQMPPTSFFDRISHGDDNSDEEEGVTEGIESVLDLFNSQGAPSRTLRWHYRSRHESLIAVSNREFYDNNAWWSFPALTLGERLVGCSITIICRTPSTTGDEAAPIR